MPVYDLVCEVCGEVDNVFTTAARREAAGCGLGQAPCACGAVARIVPCAPKVSTFSTARTVPGLKGEFKSWGEVERAADTQGQRILEPAESRADREQARQDSADYAKQIGYGSRKEYVEARKARGVQMVRDARAKAVERGTRKYGNDWRKAVTKAGWSRPEHAPGGGPE